MTLTCRDFIESLDSYCSGTLASDTRVGYEAHLLRCMDCAGYLGSYKETIRLATGACRHADDTLSAEELDEFMRATLRVHQRAGSS